MHGRHRPDRPQPRRPRPGARDEHPRPVDDPHLAELVLESRHGALLHERRRPLHAGHVRSAARAGRGGDPLGQAARRAGRMAGGPPPPGQGGAPAGAGAAAATLPGLFDFNQWNANQPGTTLFIPVTNTTLEYINLLFIYLARSYGFSIVDEQAGRRSAGCSLRSTRAGSTPDGRWASSSSSSGCCRCWSSSRRSSARTSTWRSRPSAWAAGPSPATSPAS